jgi:PhoPQ-activated pathogenicity-related protein
MRRITLLCLLFAAAACSVAEASPRTALADYVARPDASFAWHPVARFSPPGAEVFVLNVVSQTWQNIAWRHRLFIIRPTGLPAEPRQGLFVVSGGRWRDSYENEPPAELPDDAKVFIEMARRLDTVVAVLAQVPFQPMFGLREDDLIAYTFDRYLATGDPEWPLLLPMVKSVVRGMDATQAFANEEWHAAPQRFTVLGGSKRGWTTWLTGAVEPRAAALIPVVIDALNFAAHMPYQSTVWGRPSPALEPYTKRGLIDILGSTRGRDLRAIVDPYSYRTSLRQPKLIVIGTNDPYFPLDSLNLYWDALPAPKYILYAPNQGHGLNDFARLIPTLKAVHDSSAGGAPMPGLRWEFQHLEQALRLCLRAEPAPATVVAWTAQSADAGFVDAKFEPEPMAGNDGVFIYDLAFPVQGYGALFAETAFGGGAQRYTLSTNVRITDPAGHSPSPLTAVRGERGVCPPRPH